MSVCTGTLIGQQGTEAPYEVWTVEGVGQADAQFGIMEGRVIPVRLIEPEESLCRLKVLLFVLLPQQTVSASSNLTLTLCNVLRRLTDGVVYLAIECVEVSRLICQGWQR